MYFKILELSTKTLNVSYEETKDLIWHFLYALESNGQILKNYKVVKNTNLMLFVTTPKADSLSERYDSFYVKNDRKKLKNFKLLDLKKREKKNETRERTWNYFIKKQTKYKIKKKKKINK